MWLGVIGSLSLLLVAVPLAVEPAVATLLESFSRQPMVCVTAAVKTGMAVGGQGDACSWTSCRQGCTGDVYKCVHVFVNVSLIPWETLARHLVNQSAETDTDVERKRRSAATGWAISWAASDAGIVNASRTSVVETGAVETRYAVYEDAQTWLRVATSSVDLPATVAELRRVAGLNASTLWDVTRIPLLINVKGCGYPPQVDCATFHRSVASHLGTVLPCYTNQRPSPDQRPGAITMAIFRNDPQMDWWVIQAGLVAPLTVFGVSVLLLCCWHNRTCHRLWRWAAGRCWRRRDVAYRCPASDSSLKFWTEPVEESNESSSQILLEPLRDSS